VFCLYPANNFFAALRELALWQRRYRGDEAVGGRRDITLQGGYKAKLVYISSLIP
jgi:hypothetical protein